MVLMTKRLFIPSLFLIAIVFISACEPLAYNPTAVPVIITNPPTATVLPTITPTPTITRTPFPTDTPDFTPTPTSFPCDEEVGQIVPFARNVSEVAGGENLRFNVYLPPCYQQSGARFPSAILLHGLSYRENQWEDLGLIDALDTGIRNGTLAPMVIVMPYMGNFGQVNQFPPDPSYETHILDELVPSLERNFCLWQNPAYRALGGISRGGFWAYSIAMRHPDVFGVVGGHSAYFSGDTVSIPPPFNPLEIAVNSEILSDANLRMYLDNGASDSSGPSQQTFSSRLTANGIPHTYVVHPVGEHNNDYWLEHVGEYLTFYGETWEKQYSNLPSCAEPSP
jgi:enterochelin esterase-like enzyme